MAFPVSAYLLFVPSILLELLYVAYLTFDARIIAGKLRLSSAQLGNLLLFALLFFFSNSLFLIIDTTVYDLPDPVFIYILFIVFSSYLFGAYFGIGFYVVSLLIAEYYLFGPNYTWPLSVSTAYSLVGGIAALYVGVFLRNKADELQVLNRRLLQQVSDKDKIANMIVHDIRNSLSIVKLQTQLLQKNKGVPLSDVQVIDSEVGKLSAVVESVLSLAKLENTDVQLQREEFDIAGFCKEKLALLKKIHSGYRFEYEHKGSTIVRVNREALDRILNNLMDNAIKYSMPGSKIRLTSEKNAHELSVAVADEGVGIEKNRIQTLMQPYEQGSTASKGVGLGLHIIKSLTELQGGKIRVESTLNKGTTFLVSLPQ